ncbi:MAG: hypothetical protein ABJE10_01315, partial [bacterium]
MRPIIFIVALLVMSRDFSARSGREGRPAPRPATLQETAARPELPRVYLETRMMATTGRTVVVGPHDDLQAALDAARPGDEIVLQAGATYTGPFILPVKRGQTRTPAAGPVITIRSSALASLPAGRRVGPSDTAAMARLVTARNETHVIGTAPGTAGWRLAGLEITALPNVTVVNRLLRLGDGAVTQNTAASVPQNIIVDRSYVHASATLDIRRCIDLQSGSSAVIDSYLAGCHSTNGDAQALAGYNGPGPYAIINNYLEGSGENILFGGSNISVPNQVPSDIEIRRNYFFKPLTWKQGHPSYAGTPWIVKNLFELKMGRRILFEGNVLENSWINGQVGFAILLKTTGPERLPTTDVTVRNNIVRGAAGGANVAGVDGPMNRIAIENNLFLDIGSNFWGADNGRLFQAANVSDLTISHNAGFAPNMLLSLDRPNQRLTFTNNLVGHGAYGVKAGGMAIGVATLEGTSPGFVFEGNIIVASGHSGTYPPGN